MNSILHSLENGLNVFYQPKRSDMVLLYADADLTIVEGIGTAFMDKLENSVSLWFECEKEVEIERRIARGSLSREEVVLRTVVRDMQFETNVLPNKVKFDYEINTNKDKFEIKEI